MKPHLPTLFLLLLAAPLYAGSPAQSQGEQAFAAKDFATAYPLLQQAANFEQGNAATWQAIRAEIEECKKHLTPAQLDTLRWKPPTADAPVARTPHAPPKPGEVRTLAIKELGNFTPDPEKANQIPSDVLKLNGMKVCMWGFMIPSLQSDEVTEFDLVPSLSGCCYGQPPGVEHTIIVHNAKLPTPYTTKPIRVTGTLHVQEKRDSNYTISIFEIDPDKIEPINIDIPAAQLQGKSLPDLSNQQ